ncbi:MAG: hypothetical protein L0H70_04880, partial [Xanthomonadales bacterium]|nr:hypothetical protein [Xanthomonadales bacterium]
MIRLSVLVAVVLISAALNAHAAPEFCSPLPITVYVGNKSTDSQCNYDNIQAAISAAVCPETIVVTDEIVYPPQHLILSDKALPLTGSTASCGGPINQSRSVSDTLTPRIILSGNDDVDQAVITITGASHVTLNNFSISGARDTFYTSSDGGGIVFLNHGSLRLNNVELWQNYAAHGGGIAMLANGGHADLVIGAHTVIHDNVAQQNGGGIYMSGDVHLTMVSDQSAVYHNLARGELEDGTASGQGYGGGIYILGGRADIGSPGLSNGITGMPQNAVIADNDAVTGAGIFVRDGIHTDGVA